MDTFSNSHYSVLISNLLNDTQYIEISNMGKLAGLRKHAEVLVRKILDIGNSQKLMLGQIRKNSDNKAVMRAMNNLGGELSEEIIKIINNINPLGRDGTHTQHTEEFSNEEVEGVEDAILDLYALMFIRYKTWNYLFEKDRNNIQVVNKLCLSIIKLFDKETAYQWLEENREIIKAIPYPNAKEIEKYNKINSFEIAPGVYHVCVSLDFEQYENIYDLLYAKISDRKTSINESGKMYKNFEEAIEHYNREIKNYSKTLDKEFYDLMDFVYIGRRSVEDLK